MRKGIVTNLTSYRFGSVIIPILTWICITFPIWLSPFHPAVVAYFIITFNLYFLFKSVTTTYHAAIAYKAVMENRNVPYYPKIVDQTKTQSIRHFVIIPNYKEHVYKLIETIQHIAASDFPTKQIIIVLGFEAREAEAKEKEQKIRRQFANIFLDIISTYHVLQVGEAPGKASNQTCAAIVVSQYCRERNWDSDNILVTICDADSLLSPNFLSYATYEYLRDADRRYHFYWAPVLLYNNFWKLPFFVRMQATLSSIMRLSILTQPKKLIQISTYVTNLWLLEKINYWDTDIIPEDWHVYFQAYFMFGEKVRTLPLFTIVNGDAVYSGSFFKTLANRYEQEKRWAWGVSDMAYSWKKLFITPHIPLYGKIRKILLLAETHFLWPTSFFVLTLSASIPPLVNPVFKRTVLGFLLPQLSGIILTLSSLMLLVYVILDVRIRHAMKIGVKPQYLPLFIIQWYLLPIVSFFLSSIPALEAHTRILLGKTMTYKVTEKV